VWELVVVLCAVRGLRRETSDVINAIIIRDEVDFFRVAWVFLGAPPAQSR
jgi:hypothetical protein